MARTTTTSLPPEIEISFTNVLLAVPIPNLIHKLGAMKEAVPMHGGGKIRFRQYNKLATATVPLGTTGISPPGQQLTAFDIDAELSYYGTFIDINEQVIINNQDPVLNQAALRLGVCLRETEDELVREMLAATAGYVNCVNGANGDTPSNMSRADVNIVIRSLMDADAKTILESQDGENKFGTAPIRDAFLMLSSTKMIGDLDNVAGFLAKAAYPDSSGALPSEYGSISNFRIFVSSAGSYEDEASATGARVMNNFCLGMEAYACVSQNEYSSKYIYRDPMYSGPLALNATAGFKMAQVPVITNDLWLVNLRSTLS